MYLRQSLSPRRKCQTPSLLDRQNFKKNRYLKTEDPDSRNVQSRMERKVQSIVQKRSMSQHKQSLNSSFNRQLPTRKSSLQNKIHPQSTTNDSIQNYFHNSPSNNLKICQKLIEQKKYEDALIQLEFDTPQLHIQKETAYMKGIIYMNQNKYDLAAAQFAKANKGEVSGQIAMLQSVAYKKLGNLSEAINCLKEFLSKKQQRQQQIYYDVLIYRAKLLLKLKKFQLALQDFNQACILELEQVNYFGTLGRGDVMRITGKYSEALSIYSQVPQNDDILMRKVLCLIELQQFDQGLRIIDQLEMPYNSEPLYLKGLLQMYLGQINESILSFEQSIKQNNSKKAITKSLQEIAKIKIEQRDFYSAYYTLQRSDHLDVDKEAIIKLRLFTEGVIFLMKRKYAEGVNNLSQLINNYQLGDFIKKIIFNYRAYGFICLSKYQKALNDLIYMSNFCELELSSQYNKYICEGLVMAQQNQFERALSQFQKSSKLCPSKMEPHFYKSMTLMQFVQKHALQEKDRYIKNALKHLDKAITLNDQSCNLLFHRGILRFYFGQIDEALSDLNKAVDKNDEQNAKIFYVRGLVRACLNNNKQALQDFNHAVNLDSKYAEVYLNRAKVYQILGDKKSAINDLQTYMALKPQDPQFHLWAGNLLFNFDAHEDAITTYSHSNEINTNVQLLKYRAQCYIIMKELNSAMADLQKIIELTGDKKSYIDKEGLLALKTASMGPDDNHGPLINKYKDSKKALNYRLASAMLKKLIKLGSDGYVFLQSDLYFFRGVMKFYMNNYKKAIDQWTQSYKLKFEQQTIKTESDSMASLMSYQERRSELEELSFEDRTYNMYEYYYNVAMATILVFFNIQLQFLKQNKQKSKAIELLNQLSQSLKESYEDQINNFINLIDTNKPQAINIFPFQNRLCCIFPTFRVGNIETRLSFCLPHISPPSMNPEFDLKLIDNLQPGVVESKPEAPWIRRNPEGVVFTENIQNVELDLKSETVQESSNQEEEENIILVQHEQMQDLSSTIPTYNKKDIEKLKQQLMLDKNVELKLAKLR